MSTESRGHRPSQDVGGEEDYYAPLRTREWLDRVLHPEMP